MGIVKNGQKMLNVQSSRPFHSYSFCCTNLAQSNNLNQYKKNIHGSRVLRCFISSLITERKAVENNTLGDLSSQLQVIDKQAENEDNDDDIEELKKEAVWNIGPVPAASFTFAAYANDSEIVQKMLDLGVNLAMVERKYGSIPFILKLDFEKDVSPYVRFLVDNGVDSEIIGWYLTKNPFILKEDFRNLEKRLEYLKLKKFSPDGINRIINANPFWLSFSVTRMDRRLGFFQSFFKLQGDKVRELVLRGPKLITSNLGRVKDITFKVKNEMGFTSEELVKILLEKPRIWREKPDSIWRRFDYLHNTVKFSHETIVQSPALLLVRESRLKHRIGFLQHVGRAQFDQQQPNYVSMQMIYEDDDSKFATNVAKSSVLEFNEYMKCL